jgi:broad specificity phosphatase PhoE
VRALSDLVLVRHGSANGPADPPLTRYGRLQAEQLGRQLAPLGPFDQVITSPTSRARQTLEMAVGAPSPIVEASASPGHGGEVLRCIPDGCRRVLIVTHEDVIAAVVRELVGGSRSGYARASITHVRRGEHRWMYTYEEAEPDP